MTITHLTIRMDAKVTKEFQSAGAGADVTVQLDPGDDPRKIFKVLSQSLGAQVRDAARQSLEQIIYGEGL